MHELAASSTDGLIPGSDQVDQEPEQLLCKGVTLCFSFRVSVGYKAFDEAQYAIAACLSLYSHDGASCLVMASKSCDHSAFGATDHLWDEQDMLHAREYVVQTPIAIPLFKLPQYFGTLLMRSEMLLTQVEYLIYTQSRRGLRPGHYA